VSWLAATERIGADRLRAEMKLAPDEAVGPEWVHRDRPAEPADRTGVRTAADEDHDPFGVCLEMRLPGGRERSPRGRHLDTGRGAVSVGLDVTPGAFMQGSERLMVEARPHLRLPAAVDGGLEAAFLRRRKNLGRWCRCRTGHRRGARTLANAPGALPRWCRSYPARPASHAPLHRYRDGLPTRGARYQPGRHPCAQSPRPIAPTQTTRRCRDSQPAA
jgi:hypothetical protein